MTMSKSSAVRLIDQFTWKHVVGMIVSSGKSIVVCKVLSNRLWLIFILVYGFSYTSGESGQVIVRLKTPVILVTSDGNTTDSTV